MTVVVTGATGFIGGALARRLVETGTEVRGLVRPGGGRRPLPAGVRPVPGDLGDRAALIAAFDGADVVYHCAGLVADWGPYDAFHAANVAGTGTVMSAARGAGVARVVHMSSVSVYGFPGGSELDEDTPFVPRPSDPYVTSKAAAEAVARAAHGRGLEVAILRPAGVYGPGDTTTSAPLLDALAARRFVFVDGGRHRMAPIHVDNLVDLAIRAGTRAEAAGEAFNAVDDGHVTWRDYIAWMCDGLGCPMPRVSLPGALAWPLAGAVETLARVTRRRRAPPVTRYRVRAVMRDHHYATTKAKERLGWQPRIATRAGVAGTVAWYRRLKEATS